MTGSGLPKAVNGRLNYRPETILETFYALNVAKASC
jgi:hypothetical protein